MQGGPGGAGEKVIRQQYLGEGGVWTLDDGSSSSKEGLGMGERERVVIKDRRGSSVVKLTEGRVRWAMEPVSL